MHSTLLRALPVLLLAAVSIPDREVLAKGNGALQAPLPIPAGRPGPVTVNWGDFNADGLIDLAVASGAPSNQATGSPTVLVLFQNPLNRLEWTPLPLRVGVSSVYVRGADMDRDGADDLMVADVAQSAFYVHSRGDGTFDPPRAIPEAGGARWIAIADFNNDGKLDFASSNFATSDMTVFLGDGRGAFTLRSRMSGHREHTLESLDFDDDGRMDLVQGSGLPGITPFKGRGNGLFDPVGQVSNLGCIEYISEVGYYDRDGNYVLIGDFNLDGRGDLAVTCIDDQTAYAGVSLGTGAYQRGLAAVAGGGTESSAIADLDHDGIPDLALVSAGSTNLWVHPGRGDGTFHPPEVFGSTGAGPVFLISQDLDQDGFYDVISGDNQSFTVTIFWGREAAPGEPFLGTGRSFTGHSAAKAMAIADMDRDGYPDMVLPRSDQPLVNVFLDAGFGPATRPSHGIAVEGRYSLLRVADLDRDGIPDLAGAELTTGKALVALLDAAGKVRSQQALPAGLSPSAVEAGRLDELDPLDLVVACKGSNHLALFFGHGQGAFAEARLLPTVEKPKAVALGRLDQDFLTDMAVLSDTSLAVHYGTGGGEFTAPVGVVTDAGKVYSALAAGDLNGDSLVDLAASEIRTQGVHVFHGRGNRRFEGPAILSLGATPSALELADLNGDGRLDVTTSNTARTISILLTRGDTGFAAPVNYSISFTPIGHRVADLNLDGALDVAAFTLSSAVVLLGEPDPLAVGHFRRGDATADGLVAIDDPVAVLFHLFLGPRPVACADAADADDDGSLRLPDAVFLLSWLFLAGTAPESPGPRVCGRDPTDDALRCDAICP